MMITSENKVKIYEIDGTEPNYDTNIIIQSYWTGDKEKVVITVPGVNSKCYTVLAKDILAAVENSQNTARV